MAECIDHTLRSCSEARVYGAAAHTRVGASDFCREMRLRGFVAEEIEVGCSAAAEQDAIRGIEGCDSREDALQLGPCIVASWRRGPAEEGSRDDGRRLELFFDQALGEAPGVHSQPGVLGDHLVHVSGAVDVAALVAAHAGLHPEVPRRRHPRTGLFVRLAGAARGWASAPVDA